ncbi:MAG: alpha-hydroxy acid oxidase [Beijerinckiaceae bacterium]
MPEDAPFGVIPPDVLCADDYEAHTRARLDPGIWAWLDGPAGDGLTRRWNREAFDRLAYAGMRMADLARFDCSVELFGRKLAHPLILAPVAYQRLLCPDGERASAMAAAATDTTFILSNLASERLEDIAALRESAPQWFQLYWQPDRGLTQSLLQRAEAAGYAAIVLTIDAAVTGGRYALLRSGFQMPADVTAANVPANAHATSVHDSAATIASRHAANWRDVEWLAAQTGLPLLLKGLLTPEEARRGASAGVKGLIVSNHGGRCLDGLQPAIDALPDIVAACGDAFPVLMDGGVSRGSDVAKALARGARAVLVGRAYAMALAVAGPLGVAHVVRTLTEELTIAMTLTGCMTPTDLRRLPLVSVSRA